MKSVLLVTLTSYIVTKRHKRQYLSGEYIFADGKLVAQNHEKGARLGNYPSIKDQAEKLAQENGVELLTATLDGTALRHNPEDLIKKIGLDDTESLLGTLITGRNQALFIDGFHVSPEFRRGWFERFDEDVVPDIFKVKLIQQQDGRQREYLFTVDDLMHATRDNQDNWVVEHDHWGMKTKTTIEMM